MPHSASILCGILFNGLRWLVRAGCPWRMIPNGLAPWHAIHQQTMRWIKAGCFEAMAQDLRAILRLLVERQEQPTAAIYESRTLQSTPGSGERAGYDGAKKRKGSKVHIAVDTLGQPGSLFGAQSHSRQRTGPCPGRRAECLGASSHWPIRAIGFGGSRLSAGQPPRRTRRLMESASKSSSFPRPSAALFFSQGGGWSSVPLAGPHASGVSPATMSVSLRLSPVFTG